MKQSLHGEIAVWVLVNLFIEFYAHLWYVKISLVFMMSRVRLHLAILKINRCRSRKTQKNSYFLMSGVSLYTPCFEMFCVFFYGPFCHGAHKLDLSTLFTTFFLWTSLPFILCNEIYYLRKKLVDPSLYVSMTKLFKL